MDRLATKVLTKFSPFFVFLFLFSSCKEPDYTFGIIIDTNVDLVVRNAAGKNLLDPTTPGYYKPEDIRTYILQNEKKAEVNMANYDAPRDFRIFQNEGNKEYYMRVLYQHSTIDQEKTITYIQWRPDKVDTLQLMFSMPNKTTTTVDKVWYNGVLKYDVATAPAFVYWGNGQFRRFFEITH